MRLLEVLFGWLLIIAFVCGLTWYRARNVVAVNGVHTIVYTCRCYETNGGEAE